jgi:hypothetical protein
MDTTQELVAALTTDLDAAGTELQETKRMLQELIREKAILEAKLKGKRQLPPDYDACAVAPSQAPSIWRARIPHPLSLEEIGLMSLVSKLGESKS